MKAHHVLEVLADLFAAHGPPEHLRSDNGPEFTAKLVRRWLARVGVQTLFIEPGSPWENGYNESFNGKLRDEFLNGEFFYTLHEAVVLVGQGGTSIGGLKRDDLLDEQTTGRNTQRSPSTTLGWAMGDVPAPHLVGTCALGVLDVADLARCRWAIWVAAQRSR
jgi:transposase InsO family protein